MTSRDEGTDEEIQGSNRRQFLQTVGVTGAAGVFAGCLGDDENGDDGPEADDDGTDDGADTDDDGAETDDEPESANFAVSELDPAEATVSRGDEPTVSVTVENTGDEEGTQAVTLAVDGDEVGTDDVTLDGAESDTVSFALDTADLDPDDYTHVVETDDEEASGTLTVTPLLEDPDPLLSFDEDPMTFVSGVITVTGTLENSYNVALQDGSIDLTVPDDWETLDADGTDFDELAPGDSQTVTWELEVPDGSEGETELVAEVAYGAFDESADPQVAVGANVTEPLSAPWGYNASGGTVDEVEMDGVTFVGDHPLIGIEGDVDGGNFIDEVEGTDFDDLYGSEDHGVDESDFEYTIPFENGTYDVTLYFGESFYEDEEADVGERVMNVSLNEELVMEEFDILETAGHATAYDETFTTDVDDGELTVAVESVVDWPKISGIGVRSVDG